MSTVYLHASDVATRTIKDIGEKLGHMVGNVRSHTERHHTILVLETRKFPFLIICISISDFGGEKNVNRQPF